MDKAMSAITNLHAPRLCITALSGGGGKTLLSLGLARALHDMGLTVKPFKKGPDYIDAAWLGLAAGRPATNLDPFFLTPDALLTLFYRSLQREQNDDVSKVLALLEGNRGLFDGLDVKGSCSTAELARILACPILLSLNCTKMTRTAAALVQGMSRFEPDLNFCGVVLNQVGSSRHERILRETLEAYTEIPVLGALPRLSQNPLPERHMGIASNGHALAEDAAMRLESMADLVRSHLDLDAILRAAKDAPQLSLSSPVPDTVPSIELGSQKPRIGYVKDAALWFYYEDNLNALEDAGAELVHLSIIGPDADTAENMTLWDKLDGLYLGGGFPEDCAPMLSRSPRLAQVARLATNGLPIYAECGGFMLLSQGIEREGEYWPMAGIFPVKALFCSKPQGLGYVSGTVCRENPFFPLGLRLRGHEFHYSRCQWQDSPPHAALCLERGQGMGVMRTPETALNETRGDGLVYAKVWAAYTHIFAPAVPCWAPNFVAAAYLYQKERKKAGKS